MFVQQVERNVAGESKGSHLGLLAMINDYGASLAWKFETINREPELIVVTTMVDLSIEGK